MIPGVTRIFCLGFLPKAVMWLLPRRKGGDWSGDGTAVFNDFYTGRGLLTVLVVQDGKGRSSKFAIKRI
jgi:hypothetical protein